MKLKISSTAGFALVLCIAASGRAQDTSPPKAIAAIVTKYCVDCHGPDKQKGDVRFDKLTGSPAEATLWSSILQQLETGAMPPKNRPRPSNEELAEATIWIKRNVRNAQQSLARKMERPENGNYVSHEKLFDPETAEKGPKIAASPARLWRTLPVSYEDKLEVWLKSHGAVETVRERRGSTLPAPFGLQAAHEIKNYSFLYTLEGAQTAGLANNARLALIRVMDGNPKDDRSLIRKLALAKEPPSTEDVDKVIVDLYRYWIGRSPDEKELTAKKTIVLERVKKLGNREGLVAGLVPILIHPEAFFHAELGTPKAPGEPTILPADELIEALDRALRDRRSDDPKRQDATWQIGYGKPNARDFFVVAARAGKLQTREEIIAAFEHKRMPRLSQSPTVRRFLEDYFNYTHYFSVFKCVTDLKREKDANRLFGTFEERFDDGIPEKVVVMTREVVDQILEEDKQVLAQLLTIRTDYLGRSDATFGTYFAQEKKRLEGDVQRIERELAQTGEKKLSPEKQVRTERDLEKRKKDLAVFLERNRIAPSRTGVLTQRSWLVSHSTNVENHPIHRGKWIRERLLGGRIPDLPITVDASLAEDPKKTLRERMQKTRSAECWKCHRLMDPLGLPFEQYDGYGSFRTTELDRPVDTTGEIIESGDPKVDGPVSGPDELVKKLAASERVHQVFVRYAFRFWMGRNEALDDARTIQNAYRAYKESDGSMSALLRSLLTSDAFLYRTGALTEGDQK